jgi:hypothetical protein
LHVRVELTTKEKKAYNGEGDAKQALPGSWLTEKDDAGNRHDSGTTS